MPVRLTVGLVVLSHCIEVRILGGQPWLLGRVVQGKRLQSAKTVSANLTGASIIIGVGAASSSVAIAYPGVTQ